MLSLMRKRALQGGGSVQKISPTYFYGLGHYVNSVLWLSADSPANVQGAILFPACTALEAFIEEKPIIEMFPRSVAAARLVLAPITLWKEQKEHLHILTLQGLVQAFSFTLAEELDRSYNYCVTDKGNLSIARLMSGASKSYDPTILALVDLSVTEEIDAAGRSLAFTLYTASGFHILRSVEICIKAYLHAVSGSLPKLSQRNWAVYIEQLEKHGAGSNLVDLLKILKAKRNPLMHPQDSLTEPEAIDILCICQAVLGSIITDVRDRTTKENRPLDKDFSASLKTLPTL
jgi:hypothetical protein